MMMEEFLKLNRLKFIEEESPFNTETFFMEVMKKTGAHIQWENGCKLLPLRREPSIKLTGTVDSINQARDLLLERMEVQSNRIVMKIDVTFHEHPSLIGKSGKLIKKVMDNTDCHIHFPDSNKSEEFEKSNLVSISGEPKNVEKARLMLRALIPVQFFFEIETSNRLTNALADPQSPQTKLLEKELGLLIYSIPLKNKTLIVVRCDQHNFNNCRHKIPSLIETMSGQNKVNLPPVYIFTDIMPQHQNLVRGNNNCNIHSIEKRSGVSIKFPPNPHKMRNSIILTGRNLDSVYMAWQDLMSCLPISVTFDVNYTRDTKDGNMKFLQDYGISLSTFPKPKYHVKSVTLKGPEKFSKQMIQYRQHLLRLPSIVFNDNGELMSRLMPSIEYFRSTYSAIPPSVADIISGEGSNLTSGEDQTTRAFHTWNKGPQEYVQMKAEADKAKKRTIESVQVPSNIWSGFFFSESSPVYKLREFSATEYDGNSSSMNSTSSEDLEHWNNSFKDSMLERLWTAKNDYIFSQSADLHRGVRASFEIKSNLPDLLSKHNLGAYSNIFIQQEVDYEAFLMLNADDLQSLPIPYHHRMKILGIIRDLQRKTPKPFNAAPGAEREKQKESSFTRQFSSEKEL